jgi:stage II sporulation protein D
MVTLAVVGWRRAATFLALPVALAAAQSARASAVLVIEGAGDGHGVGMSQVGAEGLALHGYNAKQILSHYYTGTSLGHLAGGRLVTVLLQSGLRSIVFSGARRAGPRHLNASSIYIATSARGGRIALESEHGRLLSYLTAPLQLTGASPLTLEGAALSGVIDGRYRGSLGLSESGRRLDVINRVGLESYLKGVVPSESPATWSAAELQAQAIAARSYAVASQPQQGFDLYADTRSQQYGGYNAETPATDAAVEATIGEVVTYKGQPVTTFYFASSGGETENVQDAFAGAAPEPYLRAVLDPFDATRFGPLTMTLRAAQRKLRGLVHGSLEAIDVTRRGMSPRVVAANIVGTRGTTAVSGEVLAGALGLQSTWDCFSVTSDAAHLAADWARACARPSRLPRLPPIAPPIGSTGGGTVAPAGATGPTPATGQNGSTAAAGAGGGTVVPNGASAARTRSGSPGAGAPAPGR